MTLPPRAQKFEWNLNTLVSLAALATTVIGFIAMFVYKARDIEDLQRWQISHMATHTEIAAAQRQQDDRISALERRYDGHEFRLARSEQATADIVSTLKELQATINRQGGEISALSGDIKVLKEILQRLDARVGKIGAKPDELFGCTDDRPIWISASGIAHDDESPWRNTVRPVECLTSMEEAAAKGYRPPILAATKAATAGH